MSHRNLTVGTRVCVRVTRFSEYTDDSRPGKVLRLDFVLLDEQVRSPSRYFLLLNVHIYKHLSYCCLAN